MKQVEFVTGPGMLYQALQVYHSVYPNLDGVTILDPGLIYPISWTEPKFGEALSHPPVNITHSSAVTLWGRLLLVWCKWASYYTIVASCRRPQEAIDRCVRC